jgi:hypothetical protein
MNERSFILYTHKGTIRKGFATLLPGTHPLATGILSSIFLQQGERIIVTHFPGPSSRSGPW